MAPHKPTPHDGALSLYSKRTSAQGATALTASPGPQAPLVSGRWEPGVPGITEFRRPPLSDRVPPAGPQPKTEMPIWYHFVYRRNTESQEEDKRIF